MTISTQEPRKYNDAHLMGWAYINEVRLVAQKGKPYYSVSIAVIQGEVDQPTYLRIRSCNAHGAQAVGMVSALHELLLKSYNGSTRSAKGQRELKIRALFKASDLEQKPYQDSAGETKFRLHCRLFELTQVYVDNERRFSDLDVASAVPNEPPAQATSEPSRAVPAQAPDASPISPPALATLSATEEMPMTLVSYDVTINQ